MKKIKNTLLWISVLPASILGSLLSYNISKLVGIWCMKRYIDDYGSFNYIYNELISNALTGVAFVFVGSYIAPCHKRLTALILMILVVTLSIVAALSSFLLHYELYYYVASAALAIGSVCAYISVQKEIIEK